MKIFSHYKTLIIIFFLSSVVIAGLASCQSSAETPGLVPEFQPLPSEQAVEAITPEIPETGELDEETPTTSDPPEVDAEPDPVIIETAWKSSPHADTFILDETGQNNTCAQCHAPINWLPSMEDLPESCYACKFELEPPPPTIAESEWLDVPCKVCHKLDKKDNVQPEYAWLEIAPLDEYASVASPSELCLKCHAPVDVPGHGIPQVGGDHPGYQCTDCHSAHDTIASCDAAGCHDNVIQPSTPIPGHDADHSSVACAACHDGSGMEVGPDEESGLWTTFLSSNGDRFAFTSHNIVLEAKCDRCHFAGNPWSLSENVVQP